MDELFCTNCKRKIPLVDDNKKCPFCGSLEKTRIINVYDEAKAYDSLRIRNNEKINKKYKFELKSGDDFSYIKQKYVDLKMLVDRENDWYSELVIDKETGEIIHECNEPLSEHIGHGDAKKKK
ncbi:MAG TPA: zinc ribbon domain-containing protein [Bacteroidales bacterium]|nr:zinc ribbon domain-containing protein [Bacteroidales bacterium]